MTSNDTARKFAMSAHPHSWLLVADNLYEQSILLYQQSGRSKTTQYNGSGKVIAERDSTNRSTFLLAGFALENAIKAFLIYENPGWVSNGNLAKCLKTHRLASLQDDTFLFVNKRSCTFSGWKIPIQRFSACCSILRAMIETGVWAGYK